MAWRIGGTFDSRCHALGAVFGGMAMVQCWSREIGEPETNHQCWRIVPEKNGVMEVANGKIKTNLDWRDRPHNLKMIGMQMEDVPRTSIIHGSITTIDGALVC